MKYLIFVLVFLSMGCYQTTVLKDMEKISRMGNYEGHDTVTLLVQTDLIRGGIRICEQSKYDFMGQSPSVLVPFLDISCGGWKMPSLSMWEQIAYVWDRM